MFLVVVTAEQDHFFETPATASSSTVSSISPSAPPPFLTRCWAKACHLLCKRKPVIVAKLCYQLLTSSSTLNHLLLKILLMPNRYQLLIG